MDLDYELLGRSIAVALIGLMWAYISGLFTQTLGIQILVGVTAGLIQVFRGKISKEPILIARILFVCGTLTCVTMFATAMIVAGTVVTPTVIAATLLFPYPSYIVLGLTFGLVVHKYYNQPS